MVLCNISYNMHKNQRDFLCEVTRLTFEKAIGFYYTEEVVEKGKELLFTTTV